MKERCGGSGGRCDESHLYVILFGAVRIGKVASTALTRTDSHAALAMTLRTWAIRGMEERCSGSGGRCDSSHLYVIFFGAEGIGKVSSFAPAQPDSHAALAMRLRTRAIAGAWRRDAAVVAGDAMNRICT